MFAAWVLRLSPDSSWRRPSPLPPPRPRQAQAGVGLVVLADVHPRRCADGAELAIDQKRRKIFVTDADDSPNYKGSQERTGPALSASARPKVAVLSADSRKVLRSISYNNLHDYRPGQ